MATNDTCWRCGVLLTLFLHSLAAIGCSNRSSFSGKFGVLNSSDTTIVIKDWEGFDEAQPLNGTFVPGSKKNAVYEWQNAMPKTVVVKWVHEGDETLKVQDIDLRDIVPAGMEGSTEFELNEEGKWSVSFVKKKQVKYR